MNHSDYILLYTPPPGEKIEYASWIQEKCRVGMCPFEGGANIGQVTISMREGEEPSHDTDNKPECFIASTWRSRDYSLNDIPNFWTKKTDQQEAEVLHTTVTPILDVAASIAALKGVEEVRHLIKIDEAYGYAYAPPVGKLDPRGNPFGPYLGYLLIDPPLGPETEAFFDEVMEGLQTLPPGTPMSMDLIAPCDLNRDGVCDQRDAALFQDMISYCQGDLGYRVAADYDGSGCVDEVDQFELFGRDSDKDGVPDAGDNSH